MRASLLCHCLLAALPLAGCGKPTPPASPAPKVTVAPIEQRDVLVHGTWVGLLNGFQNAEIRAQVTAYLLTQNYKEGSLVKQGEVLFTLDSRPFEAALQQAEADYAQKVAQAQLTQITADRKAELFRTKVISEQEYDTAYQDNQAAIAVAAAAAANVQAAQVNLGYCTIKAPFNGVAGKAQAQIGDLVGPGGTSSVLTQVSQLDPMKAVFSITESEYLQAAPLLSKLEATPQDKREARIQIRLADGTLWPHPGQYEFVNRQVDVATGSIAIEALVPNPDNILRPGLFARITAPVRDLPAQLLVPQQSLVELQGGHLISIVAPDGIVSTIPVQTGPTDGDWVVVASPKLEAGMSVVVEGVEKVRPGMKVETTPYAPPTQHPGSEPGSTASPAPSPPTP